MGVVFLCEFFLMSLESCPDHSHRSQAPDNPEWLSALPSFNCLSDLLSCSLVTLGLDCFLRFLGLFSPLSLLDLFYLLNPSFHIRHWGSKALQAISNPTKVGQVDYTSILTAKDIHSHIDNSFNTKSVAKQDHFCLIQ